MIAELATTSIAFWLLSATSIASAAVVVFTRDVMRLAIGLGVFFLTVAGWYLYFTHAFLAVAQVFLYAGGVLVLVLFAIMFLRRSNAGAPILESRHSTDSIVIAAGIAFLVAMSIRGQVPIALPQDAVPKTTELADVLLGPMLPHLAAISLLLLVAVVSIVVVFGGERE